MLNAVWLATPFIFPQFSHRATSHIPHSTILVHYSIPTSYLKEAQDRTFKVLHKMPSAALHCLSHLILTDPFAAHVLQHFQNHQIDEQNRATKRPSTLTRTELNFSHSSTPVRTSSLINEAQF